MFKIFGRYSTRVKVISASVVSGSLGYYLSMNQTFSNPPEFLFPHSSTTKLLDLPSPSYCSNIEFQIAKEKLQKFETSETSNDIENHSINNYSLHPPTPNQRPKLIVYPTSTEQVSEILKICHEFKIPILPYGGGTSIEGQYISTRNGIIVDLSKLNKIKSINEKDLNITVESGITWGEINEQVSSLNLMFGPDPGPGASIGGCIATSCSGTNAFKYGTIKENVVNLTVVLADGSIIKTQKRPKKSSAGYKLNELFIGSEGTLGIITEATLKLHIKPRFETVAIASFNSIIDATNTVIKLIQSDLKPNAIELLDEKMMNCINFSSNSNYDIKPTLFFKIGNNNENFLKDEIKQIEKISKENHSIKFKFARNKKEQEDLWFARKSIFWSSIDYGRKKISPDVKIWSTDVAVPISNLSKMIDLTLMDCSRYGLYSTIVGHVGDGNFHCLIMYNQDEKLKAKSLVNKITENALKLEGTCSGEHGIGYSKREYLELELGSSIDLMRKIKLSLDPLRILNPDKIFKIDPLDQTSLN